MPVPRPALPSLASFERFFARRLRPAGSIAVFAILAALISPARARAWGCEGHQVVALLAEKHMTPHALEMAKKILAEGPIDPALSRYSKEGAVDAMADGSTWPDDIRQIRPEASPWHYIDIPLGTTRREVEKYCDPKEGCVTRAIREQLSVLSSPSASSQQKGDALRFVIHFVGDLHQPLHAVSNNDQGGNCLPVAFFDAMPQLRNPQNESYAPNLHAVWDTNILERATQGKTVEQVAAELDESFHAKMTNWQKGKADLDAWVWESYELARKDAYGKLPAQVPVEAPVPVMTCADDNHVSARLLKLDERLAEPYQDMAAPIVRQRLAQAGARLALLLNQLWP